MKKVKGLWIIWGIVLLLLAVVGIGYAAKSIKKNQKKTVDPKLNAALTANQATLMTLNNLAAPVVKKQFAPNDFSSEFA